VVQQLPHGDACAVREHSGQVRGERRVERDAALVDELQDDDGDHRLRHAADTESVVHAHRAPRRQVADAAGDRVGAPVGTAHGHHDARHVERGGHAVDRALEPRGREPAARSGDGVRATRCGGQQSERQRAGPPGATSIDVRAGRLREWHAAREGAAADRRGARGRMRSAVES
jgi:hypothetical protein